MGGEHGNNSCHKRLWGDFFKDFESASVYGVYGWKIFGHYSSFIWTKIGGTASCVGWDEGIRSTRIRNTFDILNSRKPCYDRGVGVPGFHGDQ